MQGPGPESWHPRPQFLFAKGAGPLFDIGPYYLTTLVQLLGPIAAVQAAGHRARHERVIGTGPDAGTRFPVEVDTHVSVLTRFRSGVVGTSVYSFDSAVRRQRFEITGEHGVLRVPVSGFNEPPSMLRAIKPDTGKPKHGRTGRGLDQCPARGRTAGPWRGRPGDGPCDPGRSTAPGQRAAGLPRA